MAEKQYELIADEDIITLIRMDDRLAMDYLIGKFKNLVRKKAIALYLIGGDREDLIQEGMIGLYKAIRDYQSDKEASFLTFADLCVSRQMYSAIKASNTKKNQPLNNYISFDRTYNSEENEGMEAISYVANFAYGWNRNPEDLLIDRENTVLLETLLMERLSDFEKKILTLYLNGYNYSAIAATLNKAPKSIDNGLQRIKKKLNLALKEM